MADFGGHNTKHTHTIEFLENRELFLDFHIKTYRQPRLSGMVVMAIFPRKKEKQHENNGRILTIAKFALSHP